MRRRVGTIVLGMLVMFFAGCSGCDGEETTNGEEGDGMSGDIVDDMMTGGDGDGTSTGMDSTGGDGDGGDTTGGDDGGGTTGGDTGDTMPVDGDGVSMDTGDGMTPMDADTSGLDADVSSCPGSEVVCNGTCVDTSVNDTHCGSCGNTCPSTSSCKNGTCECPDYQTYCPGQNACVNTTIDQDNCGSCGNSCDYSQDEVCNGGQCVDVTTVGCPDETEYCPSANQCVDTDTNDDHCGSCGNSCPAGEGCASGVCAPKIQLSGAPQKCQGKDPAINVGFTQNNNKQKCTGQVAKTTFKWALCSCDKVTLLNNYLFDAFDSKKGPYIPGGYGGSIGSNSSYKLAKGEVYGSQWSSGGGLDNPSPGQMRVYQKQYLDGPASYGNSAVVGDDAFVNGNVTGSGPTVDYQSDLTVPQQYTIGRSIQVQGSTNRPANNTTINTVCKRCQQSQQIPIAQIVDNHRNNNDNGTIGLSKNALDQPGGPRVLELPCGKYFLNRIDVSSKVTILATGRTALFVDGDVLSNDFITIRAERDAEIDVFVDGKVDLQNGARIGAPAFPALNRFYVSDPWISSNNTALGAYVYAIDGGVNLKNNGEVYGGLYTQDLTTMNNTEIHYDREVLKQDRKCCKKSGASCSADSDCCKSLICGNGTCGCVQKGGACGSDSDCCSGRSCTMGTCGSTSTDADGGGGTDADTYTPSDSDTFTPMDGDSGGTVDGGDADGGSTCVQEGGSCSADSDCCSSLLCSSGTCGTTCSQEGESCGSDGDCCSPLVCDGGTCSTDDCKNLYESCSSDSDCCSGTCGSGTCISS